MKKELRDYIDYNHSHLSSSDKDLKAIFEIMFRCKDSVIAEATESFRIRRYTYGEVEKMTDKAAFALYKRVGAAHGYIGLEMENCLNWIVAFWAILKSGNKPYLINCRHPLSLSSAIVKDLGIKYVIGNEKTRLSAEYIDIEELNRADDTMPEGFSFDGIFENEIALSTSATSLHGVVCFYTGREISDQILNAKDILKSSKRMAYHYKGSLKQLAFLPFYHVFGLFAVYFWFIFFGRTLVFLPDYSPESILSTCRKHEVTHIFAVPMLWHTIEKELYKKLENEGEKKQKKFEKGLKLCTGLQNIAPFLGVRLSQKLMSEVTDQLFGQSVGFCISGGSYLKDSALKLFNGIGYPLHNGYGMSEIGITSVELRNKPSERNENSVGRPFSSVEYKISDGGTLLVSGKSICKRMMTDGEYKTTDLWFDTGDIMEEKDGNYFIKGRKSDLIIGSNGENINPDMIEQLFDLPTAVGFSVLGLGKEADEKPTVIVQLPDSATNEDAQKIADSVYKTNNTLPTAAQIADFFFTYDALSADGAIKVGRQYVKKGIEDGSIKLTGFSDFTAAAKEKSPVNTEDSKRIKELVAKALSINAEDIGDDMHLIHDLGATSLQYFSIILSIGDEFQVQNWKESDSYCYTVRELCDYIERHRI